MVNSAFVGKTVVDEVLAGASWCTPEPSSNENVGVQEVLLVVDVVELLVVVFSQTTLITVPVAEVVPKIFIEFQSRNTKPTAAIPRPILK